MAFMGLVCKHAKNAGMTTEEMQDIDFWLWYRDDMDEVADDIQRRMRIWTAAEAEFSKQTCQPVEDGLNVVRLICRLAYLHPRNLGVTNRIIEMFTILDERFIDELIATGIGGEDVEHLTNFVQKFVEDSDCFKRRRGWCRRGLRLTDEEQAEILADPKIPPLCPTCVSHKQPSHMGNACCDSNDDRSAVQCVSEGVGSAHEIHDHDNDQSDSPRRDIACKRYAGSNCYSCVEYCVAANRCANRVHRKALARGIPWRFTGLMSAARLTVLPCFFCGRVSTPSQMNALDRVRHDLPYSESTTVPCCSLCNIRKMCLDFEVFYYLVNAIADYQRDGTLSNKYDMFCYVGESGYAQYKRGARGRCLPFTITEEQFDILVGKDERCVFCGCLGAGGIDRWDNTEGYTWENCKTCCWSCNASKGRMSADEFLTLVNNISREYTVAKKDMLLNRLPRTTTPNKNPVVARTTELANVPLADVGRYLVDPGAVDEPVQLITGHSSVLTVPVAGGQSKTDLPLHISFSRNYFRDLSCRVLDKNRGPGYRYIGMVVGSNPIYRL
eukprot:GHVU01007650.1.p1 GENE.GHVU01007650.1~~GHVU01007650.1.p1  ORF type:complete len:554 (-),score=17.89 GHVU01007650.1:5-1666(-)